MHIVLHILKKDVRRLWWGIAIAILLQAAAAIYFASDKPASAALSLLLIGTWACLIALAVHEDPLVGDRQFWISRPVEWRVLLASKLLFAAAVVHVPALVADVALLAARGFRPWEWLASLLTKQLLIGMALTLPVIALAAMLRSFAHLALAVIAIAGLTDFASNFTPMLYSRWRSVEDTRMVLFCLVLAVAAAAIIPWQFARRKPWPPRLVGLSAVVLAELLLGLLSPIFVARVRAAAYPTRTSIAFHLSSHPAPFPDSVMRLYVPPGQALVARYLPLSTSGIPANLASLSDLPMLYLVDSTGRRYPVNISYISPDWMVLVIGRDIYESLKNVKVELTGAVPMVLYRPNPANSLPVGANQALAGVGRCSSEIVDLPRVNGEPGLPSEGHRFLRVVCESPDGFPLPAFVRLTEPGTAPAIHDLISVSRLLSPIGRVECTFPLGPGEDPSVAGKLEITSDIPSGWQVVDLDFHDVRLADYE